MTESLPEQRIALIGAGTIGLSFAALHLSRHPTAHVTIYDSRPDLEAYIAQHLPGYLSAAAPGTSSDDDDGTPYRDRLTIAPTLGDAVADADIVQEQGPENAAFKVALWPTVEAHAPPRALLWSSTSGIAASVQGRDMAEPWRLTVVHPYNPPHVMPMLEVVPAAATAPEVVERTLAYWRRLGRAPVHIRRECVGFVANRLAFALFREACSLVAQGVVGVEELDAVVTSSMGPRWSVAGPFQAYHAGGGEGGLRAFMEKIGGTVQECWDAGDEAVRKGGIDVGGAWQEGVCKQADEAYGVVDTVERDERTRRVLAAASKK